MTWAAISTLILALASPADAPATGPPLVLENREVRLEFGPRTGAWVGLIDRRSGRALVTGPGAGAGLVPPGPRSLAPAWEAARPLLDLRANGGTSPNRPNRRPRARSRRAASTPLRGQKRPCRAARGPATTASPRRSATSDIAARSTCPAIASRGTSRC